MGIKYSLDIGVLIAAVITVVGAVITAVITYHEHKKQQWIGTVAKERIDWLKSFREEIGKIVLAVHEFNKHIEDKDNCHSNYNETIQNGDSAKYVLISRLNTNSIDGNEFNFSFKEMLLGIDFYGRSKIDFDDEEFMRLANLILEKEWAKIKEETKYGEK